MESGEGGSQLSSSTLSDSDSFDLEEAVSSSTEEEGELLKEESDKQRESLNKLTLLKDEQDGDSSLYSISDLEEDSDSDICFTDLPSLITMDEDPKIKTNASISQVVSRASPEHSNRVR